MLEYYGIIKGLKIQADESINNYFYLGKGLPLSSFGINDDYYIDLETNHLYKKNTNWEFSGISKKFPDNNIVNFSSIPDGPEHSFVFNHNLNYFPKITILDSNDDENICNIKYLNSNSIKIIFNNAFSGKIVY